MDFIVEKKALKALINDNGISHLTFWAAKVIVGYFIVETDPQLDIDVQDFNITAGLAVQSQKVHANPLQALGVGLSIGKPMYYIDFLDIVK